MAESPKHGAPDKDWIAYFKAKKYVKWDEKSRAPGKSELLGYAVPGRVKGAYSGAASTKAKAKGKKASTTFSNAAYSVGGLERLYAAKGVKGLDTLEANLKAVRKNVASLEKERLAREAKEAKILADFEKKRRALEAELKKALAKA